MKNNTLTNRELALLQALNGSALVAETDIKGDITYANDTFIKISKYSRKELIGQNHRILKSGHHSVDFYKDLWKTITSGEIWRSEIKNRAKDGSFYWVDGVIAPILNSKGEIERYISIRFPITDKKRAEEALLKEKEGVELKVKQRTQELQISQQKVVGLNELLKLMNKTLRHDILNDLTVASGNIDTYFEYGKEKVDIEQVLSDVRDSMNRGIEFIHKMKELETALTTGAPLDRVHVREIVEKGIQEFKEVEISINGDAEIMADSAFDSVITNLFRNAVVHGQTKKIDVAINEEDSGVVIKIIDYGKGIPDEVKQKLFTEGFKYGKTGHSGLGLYIVKKTIERYGGTVSVEDNKPQGSVFVLKLPKVV